MVEWNADAVATIEHNRKQKVAHVADWPIEKGDVREIDWNPHRGKISFLAGGPPCQPFAIGGKKAGHEDVRDMWPEAVRAVRETRPDAFVWENVRNLGGPKFRGYLDWVLAHLSHPDIVRRSHEAHADHLARIQRANTPPAYVVNWQLVNAADYGAPQIRWRIIISGFRADLNVTTREMAPSHTKDRLLWDQWVTGDYWDRHAIARPKIEPGARDEARAASLKSEGVPVGRPWITVRDALKGLGEPNGLRNHILQPGARRYPGHTGSEYDMPSKALKAGGHGVPGGENMLALSETAVRYFTTREAARLMGLPDDFTFPRSWSESMRQMGNAVPVALSEAVGLWIKAQMGESLRFARA